MGPTAKVFLKTEVTDELAIRVDAEVRSIASEVSPTRKGRDWEIGIDSDGEGGSRPFHVHLWDTRDQLWDCEDQLLALKLSASDLPAHIAFSAGINQPEDHMLLERITKAVANAMDGIPTEPSN